MKFRLPDLPYGLSDLEPFLSREQLELHYRAHHQGYIDKVNQALLDLNLGDLSLEYIIYNHDGALFDNGAQAWNHTFFWLGLTPRPMAPAGGGALLNAIQKKFGSLDGLRTRFIDSAAAVFGSGWTWLVVDPDGDVGLVNTSNADNPLRHERVHPIWTCDVWEHAYYMDYRNERRRYLQAAWERINWEFVERNYASLEAPNMTRLMTDARGSLAAL